MFKNLDYAKIAQAAKEYNPEKLLEKTGTFKQGIARGKKQQLPFIALAGLLGMALGAAAVVGAAKIKQMLDDKAKECDFIELTPEEETAAEEPSGEPEAQSSEEDAPVQAAPEE